MIMILGFASMSSVVGSAIGGVLYNNSLEQDSGNSDAESEAASSSAASAAADPEPASASAAADPAPASAAPEPVDCVGEWSQEPCSVQCGGGTKVKIWTTSVEPQHGGNPCPSPKTKTLPCNSQSCAATVQPPAGVAS